MQSTSQFSLMILAFLFAGSLTAQFGITGYYTASQDNFTSITYPDGGSLGNGFEVAVDYWFRLPTKRIEFTPSLSFGQYNNTIVIPAAEQNSNANLDYNFSEIGFQFKTNFYLLDFGTDCDCPTFGKQGPALHKGFFVQIAPGLSYLTGNSTSDTQNITVKDSGFSPTLGLGLGLDLGLSNLVTLTPTLHYRYHFIDYEWAGLNDPCEACGLQAPEANNSTFLAGIRLGIRLDERRY